MNCQEDGTEVTNFHDGLAKLCGTTDAARVSEPAAYYSAVDATMRRLEQPGSVPSVLSTDPATLRLNRRYTAAEFQALRAAAVEQPGL